MACFERHKTSVLSLVVERLHSGIPVPILPPKLVGRATTPSVTFLSA